MKLANKIINILIGIHVVIFVFLRIVPISSDSMLYILCNLYPCIIYGLLVLIIIKLCFYYDRLKNKENYEDKTSWH